jgi:AcrR family transcriptional regulator
MPSSRERVLAAARAAFAAAGYGGATYRAIAAEAGVDPSLVVQQFGSKRDLFAAATALPAGAGALLAERFGAEPDRAGERVAAMLGAWLAEAQVREALVARVRAAATDPEVAAALRAHLDAELGPFARATAPDRPELRTALLAAELIGAVTARELLELEPLAALAPRELVAVLAPALQRCLTGPL